MAKQTQKSGCRILWSNDGWAPDNSLRTMLATPRGHTGARPIGNRLSKDATTPTATDQLGEHEEESPGVRWPWRDSSGPWMGVRSRPENLTPTLETTWRPPPPPPADGRGYRIWLRKRVWLWRWPIANRSRQTRRWGARDHPGGPYRQAPMSEMLRSVQQDQDPEGPPRSSTRFARHYLQMSTLQNHVRSSAQARMPCTTMQSRRKNPVRRCLSIRVRSLHTPLSIEIGRVAARAV